MIICLDTFLGYTGYTLLQGTITLHLIVKFNASKKETGELWVLVTAMSVIILCISMVIFYKFPKQRYLGYFVVLFIHGISYIVLPFCPIYWFIAVLLMVPFVSMTVIDYNQLPLVTEKYSDKYGSEYVGRIASLLENMYSLSAIIFGALGGPLINLIGFDKLYLIIGVIIVIVSFFNFYLRENKIK